MSHTNRKNWKGQTIKDGEHGKRCPEPDCDYCMNGRQKRPFRRKIRHMWKAIITKEETSE